MLRDETQVAIADHCKNMGDRFAIFDGPQTQSEQGKLTKIAPAGDMPKSTDYAAWYFPWIKVFDASARNNDPSAKDGKISVPPSGHIAGIYARVDNERGVHKAPANESIRGALDVTQRLSKAHQDGLNPKGVNCIRVLNDNILVWGARTAGGDDNLDLKYISVRRTLLFLRKSIDEGTQWVVFEPNSPALWQKITRNVSAFLTDVWRSGALFGDTPQQAFYVRCDSETNPQSSIDNGKVVTEIGVAIVRPAEFVIFRISQMAGAGS
jgi:phage tail sheath protein FI